MNHADLKVGMSVKIDPLCLTTRQRFGISHNGKKSLLGKIRNVDKIAERSKYGEEPIIVIKGWYFDAKDLTPHTKFKELMISSEVKEVVHKNKEKKPKIYFNPEIL